MSDNPADKLVLSSEIDFANLVLVKKDESPEESNVSFYCKDCKKLVKVKKHEKKLRFHCLECKGEKVAFGTEKSLISHYNIKSI